MSLLMKALEQAAKDRATPRVDSPSSSMTRQPLELAREPTLESPPAPRLVSSFEEAVERPTPASTTAAGRPVPSATPISFDKPPMHRPLRPGANTAAQPETQRFVGEGGGFGEGAARMLSYLRGNPLLMIAAVAILVGIAFGMHVYLQVAKPSALTHESVQRVEQPTPHTPEVVADVAAGSDIATERASEPAAQSTPPASAVRPDAPPPAPPSPDSRSTDVAGRAPTHERNIAAQTDAPSGGTSRPARTPIPTSAIIADPSRAEFAETPPPAEPRPERTSSRKPVDRAPPTSTAPQPTGASESRERIAVSPAISQSRVNPQVAEAYALLQAGDLGGARAHYTRAIEAEPLNIDALLGVAYVAAQENRSEEAMKTYLRILQLNPRHAIAQAALIALMGRADPTAAETRLKQLLSREPSAFLHFVLGNLYSDQSSWSQAQRAYFQAHHLEPDNPDYAYNLAVGLDHLRQSALALEFYRRAEQLATTKGRSNFDVSNARARISDLSSQLQ